MAHSRWLLGLVDVLLTAPVAEREAPRPVHSSFDSSSGDGGGRPDRALPPRNDLFESDSSWTLPSIGIAGLG